MPAILLNSNLMLFHLCLLILLIMGVVEFLDHYLKLRLGHLIRRFTPKKVLASPWFHVQFSPTLIVVFFLMNFSFFGYLLQFLFYAKQDVFAPTYYIILPALTLTLFFTVFMIHCLNQVIPSRQNKTRPNLLGRLATISSGSARPGFSAQARVRDEFGELHYVQVEPEFGELEFQSHVILIRQRKSHYLAKKIAKSNQLFYNSDQ